MKAYLFLFVQLGVMHYANAQWEKVVLRTDAAVTETITDAFFINIDTGFVVTEAGILYKTADGGLHWTYDTINTGGSIQQIQFPTADTGYMTVSDGIYGGTVLKTVDGGNAWFDTGQGNDITFGRGLHFFNADTGMVGAYEGAFRTTDGGQTWQRLVFFDQGSGIVDLRFVNDTLGFAYYKCFGGNFPTQATLSISKDKGYTWNLLRLCDQPYPFITTEYYFCLLDDSTFLGFDQGWRLMRGNIPFSKKRHIFPGDSLAVYNNPNFMPASLGSPHNIRFYNRQLGMVAYRNAIIRTEDGGETWDITDFGYTTDFDSNCIRRYLMYIVPVTANKWIVMGGCGRIYMTENRGGLWTNIEDAPKDIGLLTYPNPVNEKLTCSFLSTNAVYTVSNIQGAIVIPATVPTREKFDIDVSHLSSGIYYLTVYDDKKRYVKKFVKQ